MSICNDIEMLIGGKTIALCDSWSEGCKRGKTSKYGMYFGSINREHFSSGAYYSEYDECVQYKGFCKFPSVKSCGINI